MSERRSRWDLACLQFDAVFHGAKADKQKEVAPIGVERDLDGRIARPRTAELAHSMRKRLEGFRELDTIAFLNETEIETRKGDQISRLPLELEEENKQTLKRFISFH
jgi:hypothetical protein